MLTVALFVIAKPGNNLKVQSSGEQIKQIVVYAYNGNYSPIKMTTYWYAHYIDEFPNNNAEWSQRKKKSIYFMIPFLFSTVTSVVIWIKEKGEWEETSVGNGYVHYLESGP